MQSAEFIKRLRYHVDYDLFLISLNAYLIRGLIITNKHSLWEGHFSYICFKSGLIVNKHNFPEGLYFRDLGQYN